MKIINPATEEVIKEIEEDNFLSIQKKFHTLKENQKSWFNTGIRNRLQILKNFVDLLQENRQKLIHDLNQETGKSLAESQNEIKGACYRAQFFLDTAEKTLQEKLMNE